MAYTQAYKPNTRHLEEIDRQKLRQILNILKKKTIDINELLTNLQKIQDSIPQKYSVQKYGSHIDATDYIEKDEDLLEATYESLNDFIEAFTIAIQDGGQ